jgi:hypothetical protein
VALDVELTTVRGRWLRHTPAGANPATRPMPADDNRWQRGTVVYALYLYDEASCVWAEWYRHLAERAIPPQAALPRDLWTYEIAGIEVADLRTPERLTRVSLPVPQPGRTGWTAFQAFGEQLHTDGCAGLIAPSAARPQSLVLCLFLATPLLPAGVVPNPPPTRVGQSPAPSTGMRT